MLEPHCHLDGILYHFELFVPWSCDRHEEMSIYSAAVRRRDKAKILFRIAILEQNLAPKAPKILCQASQSDVHVTRDRTLILHNETNNIRSSYLVVLGHHDCHFN